MFSVHFSTKWGSHLELKWSSWLNLSISVRPGPPLLRYRGEVLADLRVILEKMQSSWKEGLSELQGWSQSLSVYVCLGNGFWKRWKSGLFQVVLEARLLRK